MNVGMAYFYACGELPGWNYHCSSLAKHSYERIAYLARTRRAPPLGWMPIAITFSDSPRRPRYLSTTRETEQSKRPFLVCIVWKHSLSNSEVCLVCSTHVETLNDESKCSLVISEGDRVCCYVPWLGDAARNKSAAHDNFEARSPTSDQLAAKHLPSIHV